MCEISHNGDAAEVDDDDNDDAPSGNNDEAVDDDFHVNDDEGWDTNSDDNNDGDDDDDDDTDEEDVGDDDDDDDGRKDEVNCDAALDATLLTMDTDYNFDGNVTAMEMKQQIMLMDKNSQSALHTFLCR